MPNNPFEPYALKDATDQLDKQYSKIKEYLKIHTVKQKKKGFLRRLFNWLT